MVVQKMSTSKNDAAVRNKIADCGWHGDIRLWMTVSRSLSMRIRRIAMMVSVTMKLCNINCSLGYGSNNSGTRTSGSTVDRSANCLTRREMKMGGEICEMFEPKARFTNMSTNSVASEGSSVTQFPLGSGLPAVE